MLSHGSIARPVEEVPKTPFYIPGTGSSTRCFAVFDSHADIGAVPLELLTSTQCRKWVKSGHSAMSEACPAEIEAVQPLFKRKLKHGKRAKNR